MFFGLTSLGGWYLGSRTPASRSNRLLRLAFALGLYALLDEATQPWVGRTASLADFGADVLGILAGCWVVSWRGWAEAKPGGRGIGL